MPPFGPWLPDQFTLNTDSCSEALNVLPGANSWKPWPAMVAASAALGSACKGAFIARNPTDGSRIIFAGTASGLFKFTDITSWEDVTRTVGGAYTVATDQFWQFAQFGAIVIAVASGNAPQAFTIGSSTDFDALGGSPPQARLVSVIGDFVVLGDIASPSDGRSGIIWSGLNDATHWTVGQKGCDRQIFPDGGFVTGLTSLEAGVILQNDAVRRFARVPSKDIFNFARIEGGQGTNSPYSVIEYKGQVFYYGRDGFAVSSAGSYTGDTGVEVIDEWFADEVNLTRLATITGTVDPTRPRVVWAFPSSGNSTATLDRVIGYDIALQRWFHANIDTEYMFSAASAGVVLDSESGNVDDIPDDLVDDLTVLGGVPFLGAFSSAHKLSFFTGAAMEATLRTALWAPVPGKRFYTNGVKLTGGSSATTGRVGVTERTQDQYVFNPSQTVDAQGEIHARASGAYGIFEINIPAGGDWQDVAGLEPHVVEDGER